MKYTFKVKYYSEIDLARISRDNPKAVVLVVTGYESASKVFNGALLLNKQFLSRFDSYVPSIILYNNTLNSAWGIGYCTWTLNKLPNHRMFSIRTKDLPEIINELRKAKKSLRDNEKKYTITVSELDINDKAKSSSKIHPDTKDWRFYHEILCALDKFEFIDEKPKPNSEVDEKVPTDDKPLFLEKSLALAYDMDKRILYIKDDSNAPIDKVVINGVEYEKAIPF